MDVRGTTSILLCAYLFEHKVLLLCLVMQWETGVRAGVDSEGQTGF